MQWTDRIRQVKIILVVAALIIAVASLLISHFLVFDLSKEEHNRMEVWAQALHALNAADESTDLTLVLNVIEGNNTIPVIVLNDEGGIDDFRNIRDTLDIKAYAQQMLKAIQAKEKETQDKVNKEKAAALQSRQKEKNW